MSDPRIAAEDKDAGARLLEELEDFLVQEEIAGRSAFWTRVERKTAEIASYDLAAGRLPDDLEVKITKVQPEASAIRFTWPNQRIRLRLDIRNDGDRALPGGDWALGGRMRVLWKRHDSDEIVYGTEAVLEKGLLPDEHRTIDFHVNVPEEPGPWIGRVIVNQQDGARFHRHEDHRCTFATHVFDTSRPLPPCDLSAAEIYRHFTPDQGMEDWSLSSEEMWVLGVVTQYRCGFTSRPFLFDGTLKTVRVEHGWFSTIDGAEVMQLEFIPLDGAPPHDPVQVPVNRSGVHVAGEVIKLPKLEGRYKLRFIIGMRQGMLEMMLMQFR